ncbi:hypothetical protein POTOM_006222 [Populus tomentosa]|uniref:Uncharacterized protein n=1 Tax=Populus tomentosa TaxID=118781 RepID=A0A8X8ANG4_POPTO|nr:hypothetical protein POTOM_006222 [Populus tomentosa]
MSFPVSPTEMAKGPEFPYHKLKHEGFGDEHEERQRFNIVKSRRWYGVRRVRLRKRFRLKVPSLGRFLRRRVKLSCAKVLKRLKEGQAHFGDLFAGNYLFMQVNPTPLKYFERSYYNNSFPPGDCSLPRIAH